MPSVPSLKIPVLLLGLLLAALPARAGETLVAVAANFTAAANEIAAAFAAETGHTVKYSFGATGQLYAQISQGAPFEAFLAADAERPALAVEKGFAVSGSRFTYALGKLVLWSADPGLVDNDGAVLRSGTVRRVAIANPVTAPYGAAAVAALKALGVYQTLVPTLVQGSNIAQTYQFVATGNAQLGFVALSRVQVALDPRGSRWIVPDQLYPPIRQDAVLLKRGADNDAARAYVEFLRGTTARAIIERYGYGLAPDA